MNSILLILTIFFKFLLTSYVQPPKELYTCKPCGLVCDNLTFEKPGECPHCNMKLIASNELEKNENLLLNDIKIEAGSGKFIIEGGEGKKEKIISIYYYKPQSFSPNSPILLVIPGSGRDADEYRDSWIEAAEQYGVLIISPEYSEKDYSFGDYHLGGLLYDMNLKSSVTYKENSNIVFLDESQFRYKVNSNSKEWIFNDFDRIFEIVVNKTNSNQTHYDIFGHSAGGQILHRLVLFHPTSKAKRILASNSGFYTLPDLNISMPFGLKETPVKEHNLAIAFENELVLFLGELDNENETHGTMLSSPPADKQGIGRLDRGKYFYKTSKEKALELDAGFKWKLEIIPDTGHNFRKMGAAAAKYLYGEAK